MESERIVGAIRRTRKGAATTRCCLIAHEHLVKVLAPSQNKYDHHLAIRTGNQIQAFASCVFEAGRGFMPKYRAS